MQDSEFKNTDRELQSYFPASAHANSVKFSIMIHPHSELRSINDAIGQGVVATRLIPRGTKVLSGQRALPSCLRHYFAGEFQRQAGLRSLPWGVK